MKSIDELWLDVLQEISARAAHEVKGALNGVVVNLEVVRSRAARPGTTADAVASFAESASDQLEAVIDLTESLLTLARAPREPPDVAAVVRKIGALLARAARAEGGTLEIEEIPEGAGRGIRAHGNIVRLLVGAAMLAAMRRGGTARVRVETADELLVHIVTDGAPPRLAPAIADTAAEADIQIHDAEHGISLAFPRVATARRRTRETA